MSFAITTVCMLLLLLAIINRLSKMRKLAKVQTSLQASEERYRTLFKFTTDGVICHAADGHVISANPAAEFILGLSEAEMKMSAGWTLWRDMTDANGVPINCNDIPCAVAVRETVHVKDIIVGTRHRKSNDVIWLQLESIPILRAGEAIADQVIVVFMDATNSLKTEDRFRVIVDASPNALLMVDKSGHIALGNHATTKILGFSQEELLGKSVDILVPDQFRIDHVKRRKQYLGNARNMAVGSIRELQAKHKNGTLIPVDIGLRPIHTLDGEFTLVTIVDVSELREAQKKMSLMAFYDDLTGLANRRFFMDRLQHVVSVGARHQHVGALLFLDIDNFKTINDTLGHDAGDLLLKEVASRLLSTLRSSDSVARIGGDEFVILLEELETKPNAAAAYARDVGDKVLTQLRLPYEIRGHTLSCSASIGVVIWGGEFREDVTNLLKRSDMAMYGAKRDGKNTLRFYDPAMQEALERRMQLEVDLNRAIVEQQFLAYFQQRVNSDGHTIGAEVLLRWQHPELGLVLPANFIPVAEETGMIVPIGKWVLETACKQLNVWSQSELTRELVLSVNISAVEFKHDSFVDEVARIVRTFGVNPARIEIEITESMLFEHVDTFIAKMTALRQLGLTFSLDDFGTGYSSLSYLKTLPLNLLKIDRSFVNDIETNHSDETIVQTIISMGKTLGMTVVAEGVETATQFSMLKRHGCTMFQGYYFGKPAPVEVFESNLTALPYL